MTKEIINKEKIDKTCQIEFSGFLKTQETLIINSIDVPIENSANSQGYCSLTLIYNTEKAISELLELGQTNITFNVNCQVNRKLENGDYISIDVSAFNVQGTLIKKNDTLIFQIGKIFFTERGR